jgi:hypothetical protein
MTRSSVGRPTTSWPAPAATTHWTEALGVTPTSCLSSYRPIPPLSRQASFRIAAAWVSMLHAIACRQLGVRHLRTRPRRPQTNGKAERFIRTMLNGWAYAAIYRSSTERAAALDGWLWHYNHRRRHSALGHQPPVSRTNLPGSYSWRRHRVGVLSRRRRRLTRNRRCGRPWHLPPGARARVARQARVALGREETIEP